MKSKTCVGINIIGSVYEGELKLLKEINSHSWGKPSTVSGDSCGYIGDRFAHWWALTVRLVPTTEVVYIPYSSRWIVHLVPRRLVHLLLHHV